MSETTAKKKRGFAAMDPAFVLECAKKGGKAAHEAGTAHEFSSEEARAAGRKGGIAAGERYRARMAKAAAHSEKPEVR